jgi:DNA-binding CsgD family transcriptional regulator
VRGNGSTRVESARCECGASHFTGRELEVLLEIAAGKTSQAAAMALGIKPDTVNEHIANMNAKAGVRKRAELIAMAIVQQSSSWRTAGSAGEGALASARGQRPRNRRAGTIRSGE